MFYLTTKDLKKLPTVIRTNMIDALFAGIDIDDGTLEKQLECTQEPVLRTITVPLNDDEEVNRTINMQAIDKILELMEGINPEEHYYTFKIPKKTHGFRTINAPDAVLKDRMKHIASIIINELQVLTHDSAWAYVKGRDVIGAMKQHQKNSSRWFLKIDLKDFFGSCNKEFTKAQLNKVYPFSKLKDTELVDKLVEFATLNDGLPQGTPLSPLLTNILMVEFDYKINKLIYKLTKEQNLFKQTYIYTRYADDIIISARNNFDYAIILNEIGRLFIGTPLEINKEKIRYGSSSGRNWNLGIMYNKNNELTIGYREKQKLKSVIYNYLTCTMRWDLTDLRWLLGKLNWLHNVQPEYFNGLIQYVSDKYNINLINEIIKDIKSYNN